MAEHLPREGTRLPDHAPSRHISPADSEKEEFKQVHVQGSGVGALGQAISRATGTTRANLVLSLQRSYGNAAVTGLVVQRNPEDWLEPGKDPWDVVPDSGPLPPPPFDPDAEDFSQPSIGPGGRIDENAVGPGTPPVGPGGSYGPHYDPVIVPGEHGPQGRGPALNPEGGEIPPSPAQQPGGGGPASSPGQGAGGAGSAGSPGNMPMIRIGSVGDAVRQLQTILNERGARPPLIVDGQFGPATQNAVLTYQREHGLGADGIVGPLTWQALQGT